MSSFLAKNKFLFLMIIFTVFIIGGMVVLNDVVISLRILELKAYLRDINREASKVDHLGMVTKYRLHKQLYEEKINQVKFDQEEINTANLLASYKIQKDTDIQLTKYAYLSKPVVLIMNLLRLLLNKPPIQSTFNDPLGDGLTIAYYYERNKQYELALKKYDQIQKSNIVTETQIPNILLHQGFCLAILSHYNEARNKYMAIINNYSTSDVVLVAWSLLEFLDEIETEINRIKVSDANALEKSKKLYELIAYEDAINILKESTAEDKEAETQIKYLEARLHEETGDTEASIKIYQDMIQEDHTSEEAKLANRRLMVIASIDKVNKNSNQLKELSKKNNELIQDETFVELVETAEKVQTEIPAEKIATDIAELNNQSPGPELQAQEIPTPGGDTEPENPTPEQPDEPSEEAASLNLEEYLHNSMETINFKIDVEAGLVTPTPPPTPSMTPEPTASPTVRPRSTQTPGKTPTPRSTPTIKPTPRPTGPYQIKYRDSMGRLYKVENYTQDGVLYRIDMNTFDETGRPLSATSYNPDGTIYED